MGVRGLAEWHAARSSSTRTATWWCLSSNRGRRLPGRSDRRGAELLSRELEGRHVPYDGGVVSFTVVTGVALLTFDDPWNALRAPLIFVAEHLPPLAALARMARGA